MLYLSQMASRPAETLGFGALFFLENSNLWVIVLSRNVSTTPSVIECFFGLTMLTRIDPRLHDRLAVWRHSSIKPSENKPSTAKRDFIRTRCSRWITADHSGEDPKRFEHRDDDEIARSCDIVAATYCNCYCNHVNVFSLRQFPYLCFSSRFVFNLKHPSQDLAAFFFVFRFIR